MNIRPYPSSSGTKRRRAALSPKFAVLAALALQLLAASLPAPAAGVPPSALKAPVRFAGLMCVMNSATRCSTPPAGSLGATRPQANPTADHTASTTAQFAFSQSMCVPS